MPIRPRSVLGFLLIASCACSGQRAADPAAPPPMAAAAVPMPAFATSSQIAGHGEPIAPWTLTASDGSGLLLTRVDARAVFQGPLAFTELHLYFHNPEPRVREGTFAITLPAHAAVSRFAMENEQQWMEAEVVEKQLARRAYEDALHRRQDPALLEKAMGNQFTARVFPIPANGDKHLVISFSQELPGERYVLPLRGLPKVERLDARLDLLGVDGKRTEQVLARRNWLPDRDLVSELPVSAEAVTSGTTVAAQLAVQGAQAATPDVPASLTLLVDTSASRGLGFAATAQAVHQLLGELRKHHGDDLPVEVVAFDQETRSIFAGRAADWGDAQDHQLVARGAAGASDLGQAVAWLGAHAPHARLAVITDGVITAGATPAEVAVQLKELGRLHGIERLDVLLAGGIRDEAAAGVLVRALARPGAVLDLEAGVAEVARALDERVLVDVTLDVPGATWVYPRTIPSVRAGTRVMVYAQLARPAQSFEVVVGGTRRAIGLVGATPVLVQRAAAAAALAELEAQLDRATGEAARPLRAEIAKRSIGARVVSSQTSLLVLETEADYARYGIDRKALADVMVIGDHGIELQHRAPLRDPVAVPVPPRPAPRKLDADYRLAVKEAVKQRVPDDDVLGAAGDDALLLEPPGDVRPGGDLRDLVVDPASVDGVARTEALSPALAESVEASSIRAAQSDHDRQAAVAALARLRAQQVDLSRAHAQLVLRQERREIAPANPLDRASGGDAAGEAINDEASHEAWPPRDAPKPLAGELAGIEHALASGDPQRAVTSARAWHDRAPGDVLALIGLGDALEATHELVEAARIYGSIIDLYPSRADLRRFAGERLERVGAGARALAIDTYRRAVAERPDHLTGHRLYAYALVRAGHPAEAFAAILAGLDQPYPADRFRGGVRVLTEDAGLIGAAWIATDPARRAAVLGELAKRHAALPAGPSTRFVLYWETDGNDVDFHIQDARGGHAWYGDLHLPSGGELYADITTGYGPECFTIPGTPKAGPYRISIDYYSQGPMGYGMGLLQIVRHDGKGGLVFEDRPYVIMTDHAYVDLGRFPG
jgi:tetratricopeptide (TPR) repeat protein